jgi:hypothetical protein
VNKTRLHKIIIHSIVAILFLVNNSHGKVEAPNYNFSLDALQFFAPKASLKALQAKYGKGEVIEENSGIKMIKYYVAHIRYKFPVYVQVKDDQLLDFFAKLPSYFLHDIFHQSLINRFGKQDGYFKKEANAIYQWNNEKGVKYIYSGGCSITCFPIYYTGIIAVPDSGLLGYKPLIEKFITKGSDELSL